MTIKNLKRTAIALAIIIVILISVVTWLYWGKTTNTTETIPVIPAFVGGLQKDICLNCQNKIKKQCHFTTPSMEPAAIDCVLTEMAKEETCVQNLIFFVLQHGFFDKITQQNGLSVIRSTVAAVNETTRYFIISKQGELIDPFLLAHTIKITKDPLYTDIKAQFPKVALWGIVVGKPLIETAEDGSITVLLHQQLLNGCHACEEAGTADIAYRFDQEGYFRDVSCAGLIPTAPKGN